MTPLPREKKRKWWECRQEICEIIAGNWASPYLIILISLLNERPDDLPSNQGSWSSEEKGINVIETQTETWRLHSEKVETEPCSNQSVQNYEGMN